MFSARFSKYIVSSPIRSYVHRGEVVRVTYSSNTASNVGPVLYMGSFCQPVILVPNYEHQNLDGESERTMEVMQTETSNAFMQWFAGKPESSSLQRRPGPVETHQERRDHVSRNFERAKRPLGHV